jgi:CRISPR-associated endonuclease/helicase Cas3
VILGWLWRRKVDLADTPRRLVYCLPMRVLVEQTSENADIWLKNLGLQRQVGLHVLMGGEETDDWDLYPERDSILVGTQDMLLSRALNRGYGMSRYRWPMHFGLLHTDCLWVFDEIQLMGTGLATASQLEGFRARLNHQGCRSFWMSATLQPDWLRTVDFDPAGLKAPPVGLEHGDREQMRPIIMARKPLRVTDAHMGETDPLAKEISTAHKKAGGRTLIVVNTVARARELHTAVRRELKAAGIAIEPVLIHSRFRPPDRKKQIDQMLDQPSERGVIVISTQVVEAGVDVSARTLFTELAPWSSLVQRFGRCNRRGSEDDRARAFWIDLPDDEKEREKVCHPYELPDLARSQGLLRDCKDVGPASLETIPFEEPFQHKWVIRRRDFIELFDTTPDLAGNDIDIDRYVRDVEESDVRVFWREWPAEQPPSADEPRPRRDELCSVPIGGFRHFVKDSERRGFAYRWDYLDHKWVGVTQDRIYPGQIYVLHAKVGGYAHSEGWNIDAKDPVAPVPIEEPEREPESNDDERLSEARWQCIAEHTERVCHELETILGTLPMAEREARALRLAARSHDWGKAHNVFQDAIDDGQPLERRGVVTQGRERPPEWRGSRVVAKAPGKVWKDKKLTDLGFWRAYRRKHFRHELASALAVLQRPHDGLAFLSDDELNLVAYLVAAHHGKVRLSIRSLPGERTPSEDRCFARGVWDRDVLPAVDLGGGVMAPAVTLSLEPMELGLCEQPPFAGQPSWAERMLRLRDKLGPLRLAYLEAVLRAADMRASKDPEPEEKLGA